MNYTIIKIMHNPGGEISFNLEVTRKVYFNFHIFVVLMVVTEIIASAIWHHILW